MFNEPHAFACPYCGAENTVEVDISGGSRQEFVVDCETCCRPITIDMRLKGGHISSIEIQKENE